MFYTIYKITNLIDGKIYIGKHQTSNLDDAYMGSGNHLHSAKQKHGLENFKKEILHVFESEDEMNAKEAELVNEEFCAREDTYNICPGGKGGWGYVNQNRDFAEHNSKIAKLRDYSDETYRNRLSEAVKKSPKHTGWKKFDGFKGKKHSEETKRKMSLARKKSNHSSTKGKIWINDGISNKMIPKEMQLPFGWVIGRLKH